MTTVNLSFAPNLSSGTNLVFGGTPPAPTGGLKFFNGTAFVVKPLKRWNGTAWETKPLKRWNGTAWETYNV